MALERHASLDVVGEREPQADVIIPPIAYLGQPRTVFGREGDLDFDFFL